MKNPHEEAWAWAFERTLWRAFGERFFAWMVALTLDPIPQRPSARLRTYDRDGNRWVSARFEPDEHAEHAYPALAHP